MSALKVGQRVKRVAFGSVPAAPWPVRVPIGSEGTVIGALRYAMPCNLDVSIWGYDVVFDGLPSGHHTGAFFTEPHEIVPLTDPLAEKFIETVKTWGPLKEREAA